MGTFVRDAANGQVEPKVPNAAPSSNWQYWRDADIRCALNQGLLCGTKW